MALLWFDGYENYNDTADFITTLQNSSIFSNLVDSGYNSFGAYGRRSSRGLQQQRYSNPLTYTLADNYASLIFGFAMIQKTVGTPEYNASYPFFSVLDGTSKQLKFHFVGSEIHVYSGGDVKLGETTGFGLTYNVWRYFEVKFTINNSTGSVIITDGASTVLSLSGIDTQHTANAYVNGFTTAGIRGSSYIIAHYDDFYLCDLSGSKNNDLLGEIRVDVRRPNGAGSHTEFSPSAGSNYQNVDETYPDDDSTYNDGDTTNDEDSYALEDLGDPVGATIYGVKSQIAARKTDAGARKCKIISRLNGTDYLGDEETLSDSYLTFSKIYEDNPDDSAEFEDADIDGMEIGIKVTA